MDEPPLKVGLNLLWLGERAGGAGRAARGLIAGLLAADPETEIHLFLARGAPADLARETWSSRVSMVRLPVPVGGSLPTLLAQHAGLPALAAARGLDVVHSPANTGPVLAPRTATVVTLLDLIWWHMPADWEGDARAHRAIRRQALYATRRADQVFCISSAAAVDIEANLELARERLHVVPLGVDQGPLPQAADEAALRSRFELGAAPVILCVAQKRPYKNLATLIRALTELDGILVLPGSPTRYEDELRRLAADLGLIDRVRFLDWVDEHTLEGLYAMARCFVLPSLLEGFGLPVLEAMRRGVPVACSNTGALPEVAGDAALLFDPRAPQDVVGSLRRLLADDALARRLADAGRARAHEFPWHRTGKAALAGYRRAISART